MHPTTAVDHGASPTGRLTARDRKVILASSLGTVFEWYDFYLYGAMAAILARHFYSALDAGVAFAVALLTFAAGFLVRPLGALLFGRLGDMIGRKYTFILTMLVMGLSTFVVGLLPNFEAVGVAAPIALLLLRLLQGLALGGEYGGAATYVGEFAPAGRRGAYTAWIQTTATLGLLLGLLIIGGTRTVLGDAAFEAWGWRLPFLASIGLLAVTVWIRLSLGESPAFRRMRAEGRVSRAPLRESFGRWSNLKIVLVALFGVVAGQAVVWYTGQFYAMFFLSHVLHVDASEVNLMMAVALLVGTPFFLLFGWLSDRIGRKPVLMAGLLLAAVTYFPLFQALAEAGNPRLLQAQARTPVTLTVDPASCRFEADALTLQHEVVSDCDTGRRLLTRLSVGHRVVEQPGAAAVVRVGERRFEVPQADPAAPWGQHEAALDRFREGVTAALQDAGYPSRADPIPVASAAWWKIVAVLSVLVVYVAMVYGPLAALLVELFPARIRYTSVSLPYHIGNGWFGGLMPTIAFAMVAQHGSIFHGLWYPVVVAAGSLVVGLLFLRETRGLDLSESD